VFASLCRCTAFDTVFGTTTHMPARLVHPQLFVMQGAAHLMGSVDVEGRLPDQLHRAACSIASDAPHSAATDGAGKGALVHVSGAVLRQQPSACLSTGGEQALQHARLSNGGHRLVLGSQLLGQGGYAQVWGGQVRSNAHIVRNNTNPRDHASGCLAKTSLNLGCTMVTGAGLHVQGRARTPKHP
jgi:hypothetical protein